MSVANKTKAITQFLSDNDMTLDELKLCVELLILEEQIKSLQCQKTSLSQRL